MMVIVLPSIDAPDVKDYFFAHFLLVYFPDKGASNHLDAVPHCALGPARLFHLAPSGNEK